MKRFEQIIKQSPRKVVLEANMAALMQDIFNIAVPYYYPLNTEHKIADLDEKLEISYEELLADNHKYLWQAVANFEKLQSGGMYFHMDAQPLGDFDPKYQVFLDLLALKKVEFVRLACSGHAFPQDLYAIISMIEPKILVPIHTLKPEKLENPYGKRILPTRGEKITEFKGE